MAKAKAAANGRETTGLGMEVEWVSISDLRGHPRNYQAHPEDQLAHLRKSIEEHGFFRNIVIARDGTILAGHGVVEAATSMGRDRVPVVRMPLDPFEPRAIKLLMADNEISHLAQRDEAALASLLVEIRDQADEEDGDGALLGTGFTSSMLDDLLKPPDQGKPGDGDPAGLAGIYSRKIKAPIYEPKGERPAISALYDHEKTSKLINEIEGSGLPEEVCRFLKLAAERHTVFHFRNIAEFYAHADEKTQDLMEKSGLVIIDFNKAIMNGFVRLTERIGELADSEAEDDDDA